MHRHSMLSSEFRILRREMPIKIKIRKVRVDSLIARH